jgi:hypothetical protein
MVRLAVIETPTILPTLLYPYHPLAAANHHRALITSDSCYYRRFLNRMARWLEDPFAQKLCLLVCMKHMV